MLIGKSDVNISEFNANLVSKIEAPKKSTLGKPKTEGRKMTYGMVAGYSVRCIHSG